MDIDKIIVCKGVKLRGVKVNSKAIYCERERRK